jgi:hypothetical protein
MKFLVSWMAFIAWNWAMLNFYRETRGESIRQVCNRAADWLYDIGNK